MFLGTCGSAPGFRFCRGEAVLGTPQWGSPYHKGLPGALGGALPTSVSPALTWLFGSYVWVPAGEVCRAAALSAWCSPSRPCPLTAVSTGGRGGNGCLAPRLSCQGPVGHCWRHPFPGARSGPLQCAAALPFGPGAPGTAAHRRGAGLLETRRARIGGRAVASCLGRSCH